MKVALVHDYLNEFGGAERVLLALSEIWPDAPIYTSFYKKGSPAWERFKGRQLKVSWFHYLPFADKLVSPLRFLAPLIWNSFDFSDFDVVITSASWFVTKGVVKPTTESQRLKTIEVCYCHTPPRYLYGYPTSIEWQKYWFVRICGAIVNHFMRMYDWTAAQKVDYFIANSKNVAGRIKKFYRRDSNVIYPPVELVMRGRLLELSKKTNLKQLKANSYYLVVSRIVGAKGLELAVRAASKLGFKLKVVGTPGGYGHEYERIKKIAGDNVEFLGFVQDSELAQLYGGAKGFLALAQDEDFGITPVEAMMAGTPVIAYRGGGYLETVVDPSTVRSGQVATGVFFDEPTVESLVGAIKQFEKRRWDSKSISKYARKFSKERFKREIVKFVEEKFANKR